MKPEMRVCPKCGSGDRNVTVTETGKCLEMIGVKQKDKGYHRFKKYSKQGEKIGKNSRLARETLIIDKEAKRKYHIVEEQNAKGEWTVVHKEDESL